MKKNIIKEVKKFILMMIGMVLGGALFAPIAYKALINNNDTIWRLILVEYPWLLLIIGLIEFVIIGKIDEEKYLWSMAIGVLIGTVFAFGASNMFSIFFTMEHTTLYSKLIYIAVLLIVCYLLYGFFMKRKWEWCARILVLITLILVPGGIVINESFGEHNVHEYEAVVKECRTEKYSRSTEYYIFFEGIDDAIPIKKYTAKDIEEYDSFKEGSLVKMKKYTGILGLPAIKIENITNEK